MRLLRIVWEKREQQVWLAILLGVPLVAVITVQTIVGTPLATPLRGDLANSFLGVVAQVLAGILAIVFSVSVVAVEVASSRYTPRLFSYFASSPATWLAFGALLACIAVSVVSMGIQGLPMLHVGFLAMVLLFVFCLLTLPYYFRRTLQLLDPMNLADRVAREASHAIKKQDRRRALDAVVQLGDVAIKAFERGEDEVATAYLERLQGVQEHLIATRSTSIATDEDRGIASAFPTFGIRSPVVRQYYRVFKLAIAKSSEELALYAGGLLSQTVFGLISERASKEVLKGVLAQYQDFLDIAVESRHVSRFALVRSLRDAIDALSGPDSFDEAYAATCLAALDQSNRTILGHDDFELWKAELDAFSSMRSIEDRSRSLRHAWSSLLPGLRAARISGCDDELAQCDMLSWATGSGITHTNRQVLALGISRIRQSLPSAAQSLEVQARGVAEQIDTLWVTAGVYDVFCRICVYALFRRRHAYIKELWRHVTPADASAHWANTNLIHLDIGFLTHQLFMNLWLPWEVEGFHGAAPYVRRYYLLCLAFAMRRPDAEWRPAIVPFTAETVSKGDEYSVALAKELSATHAYLTNLPYNADKVLTEYDAVASMIGEWDDVFDGRASEALGRAREWLEDQDRRQEWTGKANAIIKDLPLDDSRVEAYKQAAVQYYRSESAVTQLAETEPDADEAVTELTGRCRRPRCPAKQHFTVIGLGQAQKVGEIVGFQPVGEVVQAEMAHIVPTILDDQRIRSLQAPRLTLGAIAHVVKSIQSAGWQPTVLLASDQQISSAWRDDPAFRGQMELGEPGQRYLRLDESTTLRIVEADVDHAFVLDRRAAQWTTAEPLQIEVTECEKNPSALQIAARELVHYRVLKPEAVAILRFAQVRNPA